VITQEGDRLLVQGPVHDRHRLGAVGAGAGAASRRAWRVLDFDGVTEVDSAAVALALECLREARRRKLALTLANLPDAMQHLAELYAVSELLQRIPPDFHPAATRRCI